MKKILLAVIAAAAICTTSAFAADLPVKAPIYKAGPAPMFNWTGFYAGVNGGYGWSQWSDQLRDTGNPGTISGLSPQGWFGGGQAGYNWQGAGSPWVFGLEADIQASDINDKRNWAVGATLLQQKSGLDWFGTVRGRVGYAVDRTLFYATGGWAFGRVNNCECARNVLGTTFKSDTTANGYVVGGGVEYAFAPNWSAKLEYQYINLGKNDPVNAGGTHLSSFVGTTVHDDAFHTVRIGLNYKFGSY